MQKKRTTPPLTYVVIPTYNEAANLPRLVTSLLALPVPRLEVLIVDDNSPDGTGQIADRLQERFPRQVHVLHRPKKQGLGAAYLAGFEYALAHDADTIVQMDADFSHAPSIIAHFLAEMERYDVVVGSRYVTGGQVDPDWSWWRHGLSKWANSIYVRLILKLKVKDATAGFKCWSRQALASVIEQPISSSGYIFQVEMAYVAEKLGLRVQEVPIYFEDRRIGQSKMSMAVKIEAMVRTWQLLWRYRNLSVETAARPTPLRKLRSPLSTSSS